MFRGQGGLQLFLVLIAFLAVPCMLLPKPLILKKRHEQRTQARASYGLLSPDDNAFRFQRYSGGWRAVVWSCMPWSRCARRALQVWPRHCPDGHCPDGHCPDVHCPSTPDPSHHRCPGCCRRGEPGRRH